jgi:signal recognition particle subunit SRP54
MASRILGMGDVLSLIEKAQSAIDEKEAKELGAKMMTQDFNLDDYLSLMQQMKKLGPLNKLMEMMPGVNSKELQNVDLSQGEKELKKREAIISSMTKNERKNPGLISGSPSRKKRVSQGSGTTIQDINKFLKEFDMMKKMMKQTKNMQKGFKKGLFGKMPFMN